MALCIALIHTVQANFLVMDAIDKSFKKLMRSGFYERERHHESILNTPVTCENGNVLVGGESFGCKEVDFLSYLAMDDLEIPFPPHREDVGARANDIWGWLSPTGREFTLIGLDNGVDVVDTTDPINPCIIAKMPTRRVVDTWGDIKVYNNTMYHVKDTKYFRPELNEEPSETSGYGLEVYDLLPLDQLNCHVENYFPLFVWPNYAFNNHGRSHNLVVNPESGYLYSVGTERCNGGFMMLDVKTDRLKPVEVGCEGSDNYTHDGQCVTYDGPDERYTGHEICFGFNEDTLTIWDFTDLSDFKMLSRTFYPNQAFSHQGWVNDDFTLIMLDDEFDEICNQDMTASDRCSQTSTNLTGIKTTTTVVMNITNLEKPKYQGYFDHEDLSVDHNLYVWGNTHRKGWGGNPPMEFYPDPNYAYMNNYLAGLKIVDIHSDDFTDWETVGYFDISPDLTAVEFAGAWSGYLHPSGAYAISSIERGLFMLQPRMAYTEEYPKGPDSSVAPDSDEELVPKFDGEVTEEAVSTMKAIGVSVITVGLLVLVVMGIIVKQVQNEEDKKASIVEQSSSSVTPNEEQQQPIEIELPVQMQEETILEEDNESLFFSM